MERGLSVQQQSRRRAFHQPCRLLRPLTRSITTSRAARTALMATHHPSTSIHLERILDDLSQLRQSHAETAVGNIVGSGAEELAATARCRPAAQVQLFAMATVSWRCCARRKAALIEDEVGSPQGRRYRGSRSGRRPGSRSRRRCGGTSCCRLESRCVSRSRNVRRGRCRAALPGGGCLEDRAGGRFEREGVGHGLVEEIGRLRRASVGQRWGSRLDAGQPWLWSRRPVPPQAGRRAGARRATTGRRTSAILA